MHLARPPGLFARMTVPTSRGGQFCRGVEVWQSYLRLAVESDESMCADLQLKRQGLDVLRVARLYGNAFGMGMHPCFARLYGTRAAYLIEKEALMHGRGPLKGKAQPQARQNYATCVPRWGLEKTSFGNTCTHVAWTLRPWATSLNRLS